MGQLLNLNIIPKGIPDVVNASQYDVGRVVQFALYDGATPYNIPQGATVQIAGKKGDNTIFCYDETDNVVSWSGNTVTITSTQQMTAYAGEVLAQLRVINNSVTPATVLATVNFKMLIQARPDAEGDISETEIPAIIALAEAEMYNAEAWAKGTKNGVPVAPSELQYNNNSKYWSDKAQEYAVGALHYKGAILFASLPTTGMVNGDLYNVVDAFTTDNRFTEGSGVYCAAGTNIIWDELNSLWDIAGGIGGVTSFNSRHGAIVPTAGDYSAQQISASMTIGGIPYTDVRGCLNGLAAAIPAAQVQSDYAQADSTAIDYIKNKPTLGTAAARNVPASGNASTTEVVKGDDTRLTDSRNAADVYSWAKAASKPTYTANEVGALSSSTLYAGSLTAGGAAKSATKVNHKLEVRDPGLSGDYDFDGSATHGIYFRNVLLTVNAANWSATVDSDGYYTNVVSLGTTFNTYIPPLIAISGSTADTLHTAAQSEAYRLVDKCSFADGAAVNAMVVKAKTKPTETFYLTVIGICFA